MSDVSQGDGWWIASDGKWYAPEQHPEYVAPIIPAAAPSDSVDITVPAAETLAMPAMSQPPLTTDPFASATPGDAGTMLPDGAVPPAEASSKRGLLLGMGALILVVGLGFLLFRLFSGGGGTGAASPEAAVEQFIASIAEGDPVGIAEVFDPDEIEGWIGSFTPAIDIAESLQPDRGELDDQFDEFAAEIFDAIDVEITGPAGQDFSFETTPLDNNDRITSVRVTGVDVILRATELQGETLILGPPDTPIGVDLSVVDGAGLELRDEFGGLDIRAFAPGQETQNEFAEDVHLDLVTVKKDGEWYISIGYSILEVARNSGDVDLGRPDFGRAYQLVESGDGGAESAEEAVRAFVSAMERFDYDAMIALTDPLSLPYLHDYQPVIDREVNPRDLRDLADEADLQVTTLELGTRPWNDRTLVTMTEISGRVADGTFSLNTDTWCAEAVSGDGERIEGCLEDGISEGLYELGEDDIDPSDLIPEDLGMVVIERNGRWFLDPLGTMGFYADQLAETATDLNLDETFASNAALGMDVEDFVVMSGPVASAGQPATGTADEEATRVGVALDLSGYEQSAIDNFDPVQVAVARVTSTEDSSFIGFDDRRAKDIEWVAVYNVDSDSNPVYPAVVLDTVGDVTVELFDAEVQVVDGEFDGAIGDDGRPLVLVFESFDPLEFSGTASYQTVYGYDDFGVVIDGSFAANSFGDPSYGMFAVVSGKPGETFSIQSMAFEPTPVPEPDPSGQFFDDDRVSRFSGVAALGGFDTFAFDQPGGYFDGCGPDDPDVTSYAFEHFDRTGLLLVTPYPSEERAKAAFDALTTMASPCDSFPSLIIENIEVEPDFDAVTITLTSEGVSESSFEWYARRGDVIVVATGDTYDELLEGWEVISSYGG